MQQQFRWGFMGTGWISRTVASDFQHADLRIQAFGSSSLANAAALAEEFGAPNQHGSYRDLANDPEVDVVYVTLLNQGHLDGALLAIEAGKAVLVEKPFTVNAAQARRLRDAARANGVFAMEAMWSRFVPTRRALHEVIHHGLIGETQAVIAQYSENLVPKDRIWRTDTAGGVLLDLGVYPLSFIIELLGFPEAVTAKSVISIGGVDQITTAILNYQGVRQGVFTSSASTFGPSMATILGSEGRIDYEGPIWGQSPFSVRNQSGEEVFRYESPILGSGRQYQAIEVERCLRAGIAQSPLMTLDDSVRIMELLDEIRAQVGVRFPMD